MYFLSDIVGVGCERIGGGLEPRDGLFFTLSVPMADTWAVLYRSDVVSGQKSEWQPLPRSALFPVGMPTLRSARHCRIHLYAMRHAKAGHVEYSKIFDLRDQCDDLIAGSLLVYDWSIQFLGQGDCEITMQDHAHDDHHGGVVQVDVSLEMNDGAAIPLVDTRSLSKSTKEEGDDDHAETVCVSLLEKLEMAYFGNVVTTVTARLTQTGSQHTGCKTTPADIRLGVQKTRSLQQAWQTAYDASRQVESTCRQKQEAYRHIAEKHKKIFLLKKKIEEAKMFHDRLQDAKEKSLKKLQDIQEENKIKSQALIHTLQALVQASAKVRHSKQALEGVQGQGRIDGISAQLNSRRHMILKDLGHVYDIAVSTPANESHPNNTQIEERMDITWSGAGETVARPHTSAIYSVRGQRLDPSSWKHAFESEGYQWDAAIDRESSIALGYAAHMVAKMSEYLDVPLRYPIVFRGSHSTIIDTYRPAGQYPDADTISEFPLFCLSNKDRPRFAIAVFLLSKDVIQLLQACNIPPHSPNHLLQNLHTLISSSSPL